MRTIIESWKLDSGGSRCYGVAIPHDSVLFGKKVFFLNPHSVLGEVLHLLAAAEFEVYTNSDHGKLARYLS